MTKRQFIRILIVEDCVERIERIQGWLDEDVRLINARSAGIAIGMLKRDQGEVYQGIMLDFDLQMRPITETDLRMDGDDVVRAINQYVSKSVPILIHSMNRTEPGRVVNELEAHGYFVTRIPMSRLTEGAFLDWVEHVRE